MVLTGPTPPFIPVPLPLEGVWFFESCDLYGENIFHIATVNFLSTPLPIELLSFEGTTIGTKNNLTWSTASELNNDHFVLDRSSDGIIFSSIASLPGAGNSQQVTHYSLLDEHPIQGTNYYRLQQVDFDGTSTYSQVVALTNWKELEKECIVRTLDPEGLYELACTFSEQATMALFSSSGQPLKLARLNNHDTHDLDLRSLASGMYFVRITDGDRVKSYKLLRP